MDVLENVLTFLDFDSLKAIELDFKDWLATLDVLSKNIARVDIFLYT